MSDEEPLERPADELAPYQVLQIGACTNRPEQMQLVMQQTHDKVIEAAGEQRRSGVHWTIFRGRVEASKFLDGYQAEQGHAPAQLAAIDQLRAFFRNEPHRGRLIVAFVDAAADPDQQEGGDADA